VVLWPDPVTSATLQQIWDKLAARGLPSLATRTHRRHQPHCSLTVAEHLPVDETLTAVGVVPTQPLPLRIESVGVFPTMGTLFFAPVVTDELLAEQRRVHLAVAPHADRPWPYFERGAWTPHLTLAWSLTADELAAAVPLALGQLPITGTFERGGLEDGTTGENWTAASA
jgi:2'-5' RNA ligase